MSFDREFRLRDLNLPVQDLIDNAVQSVWDTRTVMVALQSVAWNRAAAYEEDPDPEDAESEISADALS
ncbi:hypothetical protein ASF70_02490 [Rhizobium sp. Leaf321]|nr:hypothetical protein ASF70_02490 [Rhizobium sp. Leaf321]